MHSAIASFSVEPIPAWYHASTNSLTNKVKTYTIPYGAQ